MPIVCSQRPSINKQEQRIFDQLRKLPADGFLAANILVPDSAHPKLGSEHDMVLLTVWGAYSIESKNYGRCYLRLQGNGPEEWRKKKPECAYRRHDLHVDPRRRNPLWIAWHKSQILRSQFVVQGKPGLDRYPVYGVAVFSDQTEVEARPNDKSLGARWCHVTDLPALILADEREYRDKPYPLDDLETIFRELEALPVRIGGGYVLNHTRLERRREDFRELGCTVPVECFDAYDTLYCERTEARIYDLVGSSEETERFLRRIRRRMKALERVPVDTVIRCRDYYNFHEGLLVSYQAFYGQTLRAVVQRQGYLSPPLALSVMDHLATTVDALHAVRIVHLDIRPDHILLGPNLERHRGEQHRLHGLTNPQLRDRVVTPTIYPTFEASFVAPELQAGSPSPHWHPDCRNDIYSLAAVLAYCLMGERRYSEALRDHRLEPATGLEEVDVLVRDATRPTKRERLFPDVTSFLGALRAIRRRIGDR